MRVSDTQVARFFSVDPITAQYPELTPYQFASNRPIDGIDLDGLEWQGYGAGFGMSRNQMRVYQESRDHDIKNPKQYTAEEIAKANSFFADFIPIISQTKAGTEVATGIDPITKKPASRVLAVMGFVPFGKFIGKGFKWLGSLFKRKKGKVEVGEAKIEAIENLDGTWSKVSKSALQQREVIVDENISPKIFDYMKENGYNVTRHKLSTLDEHIIEYAQNNNAIVMTMNVKDFVKKNLTIIGVNDKLNRKENHNIFMDKINILNDNINKHPDILNNKKISLSNETKRID